MPTFDSMDLKHVNYGVVLNDLELDARKDQKIGNHWLVCKASVEEYAEFRDSFYKYFYPTIHMYPNQQFEIKKTKYGVDGHSYKNPEQYRYTVIKPLSDTGLSGASMSECLRLSDNDLRVDLWCINGKEQGKYE